MYIYIPLDPWHPEPQERHQRHPQPVHKRNTRGLKIRWRWWWEEHHNINRFNKQKKHCTCSTLFCTFLCHHCTTTTWKWLTSRFKEDVKRPWRNFLLFLNLDILFLRIQLQDSSPTFDQSTLFAVKTETTQNHFWSHISVAVASPRPLVKTVVSSHSLERVLTRWCDIDSM